MAETEVGSVEESKGEFLVTIRNEMNNGDFDEAKRIEREHLIPPHIIGSIANSVFDGFIKGKKFILALNLARKYDLSQEKIIDVILMEFRNLLTQGKCQEAIDWGLKNHLPDYEISRAAVKGIEIAIMDGDIEKAIAFKNEYSITPEQIGVMWQKGYDMAFEKENYFDAALLCKEFGSSERKTLLTASKAFKESVRKAAYKDIVKIEEEFNFFIDYSFDLIGEDDAKSVVEEFLKFLESSKKSNDGKAFVDIIDGTRILYSIHTNYFLKGLVHMIYKKSVEIHGNLMKSNKYEDARMIKDKLGVFEEKVPAEMKRQILEQALELHNRVLKEGDFETAKNIKDKYQLMGMYAPAELIDSIQKATIEYVSSCIRKGEFKKADFIIEDYNIPSSEVAERAGEDLKYLLASEKFDLAFDTLLKFKISNQDEELREIASKAFEKCMDKGYYEISADLGHVFELKNPNVKKAARLVWERLMNNQDFKKAKQVKKKHRLTRKDTQEIAKRAYDANMENNKVDVARSIRDDYGFSVGFFEWIIEFIKSILRSIIKSE